MYERTNIVRHDTTMCRVHVSIIQGGTQSQEYRQSRALRTMTVSAFNLMFVTHWFGYGVARCRTFLICFLRLHATFGGIASAKSSSASDESFAGSVPYRARQSVVLKLGCVGGGYADPLWARWYLSREYHCVVSRSFVDNREHNWVRLGLPDRHGYTLWTYAAIFVCCCPYLG